MLKKQNSQTIKVDNIAIEHSFVVSISVSLVGSNFISDVETVFATDPPKKNAPNDSKTAAATVIAH